MTAVLGHSTSSGHCPCSRSFFLSLDILLVLGHGQSLFSSGNSPLGRSPSPRLFSMSPVTLLMVIFLVPGHSPCPRSFSLSPVILPVLGNFPCPSHSPCPRSFSLFPRSFSRSQQPIFHSIAPLVFLYSVEVFVPRGLIQVI